MNIKEKITEAFEYLRTDLSYVAMIRVVEYGDMDTRSFSRQEVVDQSFDHEYSKSYIIDEDFATGEIMIPFYDNVYMVFEYNT